MKHQLDQIEMCADMYEHQGGHAIIVQMLRSYSDMIRQLSAITAERDALRARIEEAEKQKAFGVFLGGIWYEGSQLEDWGCDVIPLYTNPIPSPDTSELIRKSVEEEREACAQIVENADTPDCGGWNALGIAEDIRARSTKEKK